MDSISLQKVNCYNDDCDSGQIKVFNVYKTGKDGLPLAEDRPCDICCGNGFIFMKKADIN